MGPLDEYSKEFKRLERIILFFFSLNNVALFFLSEHLKWGNFISLLYVLSIFALWFICMGEYFEYRVRFLVYTMIMQIGLVMFVFHEDSLSVIVPIIIGLSIFTGLFGEINLVILTTFVSIAIMSHYVVRNHAAYAGDEKAILTLITQVVNVLISQFAVAFWVKMREYTKKNMEETFTNLHAAEQSKTNFLCNVSHELRTPINSICGISEMGIKESNLEQMQEEMGQIHHSGKRLLAVVSDILDYSELQSGNVGIEEEVYSVSTTIQEVSNMCYSMRGNKKVEVLFNLDGAIPRGLLGDEKKIRRVILNLVDNAIKFTEEGYVLIGISSRKESYGINLCIEVKDTGIGMSKESQEKLFHSFTQIDGSSKRIAEGIGLGLSITKLMVQKMGGIMSVDSEIGKGTLIKAVIPQKVVDYEPMIQIHYKEKMNIAVYVEMEQFRLDMIRGAYATAMENCVKSLNLKGHIFKSFSDLKRRLEQEKFSHLFISIAEYQQNKEYFDELSFTVQILVVHEPTMYRIIKNRRIIEICKPFNLWSLAVALNEGRDFLDIRDDDQEYVFVAPEAKILLVDDNEMNLTVAKRLLENYEMQVTTATSGKMALKYLENPVYDIVFMDHMMPEMDGIEALHRIRKMVGMYYHKVPIIALSANAVAGSREMFLNEGFTDFIEKPINISVLERKCRKYLPQSKVQLIQTKAENDKSQETYEIVVDGTETKTQEDQKPLVIGNLSVQDGLTYCRDESSYLDVLQQYAKTGMHSIHEIERFYQEKNWKEYTIAVHASKSAMKTIGALSLSDMCKALESYGKEWLHGIEENQSTEELEKWIHKIQNEHGTMVRNYEDTIRMLCEYFHMKVPEEKEEVVLKRTDAVVSLLTEFEDAAYDFDTDRMKSIIDQLCQEDSAEEQFEPIRQKIEMADYISAVEALQAIYQG